MEDINPLTIFYDTYFPPVFHLRLSIFTSYCCLSDCMLQLEVFELNKAYLIGDSSVLLIDQKDNWVIQRSVKLIFRKPDFLVSALITSRYMILDPQVVGFFFFLTCEMETVVSICVWFHYFWKLKTRDIHHYWMGMVGIWRETRDDQE